MIKSQAIIMLPRPKHNRAGGGTNRMNKTILKLKYESPELICTEFESKDVLTVSMTGDNDFEWNDIWVLS